MKKINILDRREDAKSPLPGKTTAGKTNRLQGLVCMRSVMKKACAQLPLFFLLNGCFAPPIIPSDVELQKISTLLIVPVEAPPLEIMPDPIYDRIPAFRHFDNMSLSLPSLPEKVYQNKAGVVIAGRIGPDDPYQEVKRVDPKASSLAPLGEVGQTWLPTRILAKQAVSQINKSKINAILSDCFYRIPITNENHAAHMNAWHDAIIDWYGLNQTAVDYNHPGKNTIDAIVEIAIGNYRVFESQTSLQVFIKLIDPKSGRVLARSREAGYVVGNEALSLFNSDSEPFKQLVTDMGGGLLRDVFHNIGLMQKSI
jgi:hypothetical protein